MKCPHCNTLVDEHDRGRCLDAWVAEVVMGQTTRGGVLWDGDNIVHDRDFVPILCPYYSTYIAAAWEAHRTACGWLFSKRNKYLRALEKEIRPHVNGGIVTWPDAIMFLDEMAICRAALKATQES